MAQSLEVNIKTTSDVPQAMDKAKTATAGFSKQIEDVNKRFSAGFKDIFLSYFAPLALLHTAISLISSAIEKSKQDAKEAKEFAEKSESDLLNKGTKTTAQLNKEQADRRNEEKLAAAAPEVVTGEFLRRGSSTYDQGRAQEAMRRYDLSDKTFLEDVQGSLIYFGLSKMETNKKMQDIVDQMALEEKQALDKSKKTPGQEATSNELAGKSTTFKGPEGFSNVVGMGANPVMEAMTAQLEETRKQTAILETISRGPSGGVPVDFTKTPTPSRASLLQGGK
jgi:hypothetical protein